MSLEKKSWIERVADSFSFASFHPLLGYDGRGLTLSLNAGLSEQKPAQNSSTQSTRNSQTTHSSQTRIYTLPKRA